MYFREKCWGRSSVLVFGFEWAPWTHRQSRSTWNQVNDRGGDWSHLSGDRVQALNTWAAPETQWLWWLTLGWLMERTVCRTFYELISSLEHLSSTFKGCTLTYLKSVTILSKWILAGYWGNKLEEKEYHTQENAIFVWNHSLTNKNDCHFCCWS